MRSKVMHMSPITVSLVMNRCKTIVTRLAVKNINGEIIEPYKVGDIINVKESCALVGKFYRYKSHDESANPKGVEWKLPHEMPISACRLVLVVTSIKLINIKDTTKEDALKEGILEVHPDIYEVPGLKEAFMTWQQACSALWNKSTAHRWKNGQNVLWRDNPKVWKIEFKRIAYNKTNKKTQKTTDYANRL